MGISERAASIILLVFLIFRGCEEDHRASASQLRRGSQPVSGQGTRGQADATRPLLTAHHSQPPFMSSVVFSNIYVAVGTMLSTRLVVPSLLIGLYFQLCAGLFPRVPLVPGAVVEGTSIG